MLTNLFCPLSKPVSPMFVRTAKLPFFDRIFNSSAIFIYRVLFWKENLNENASGYWPPATGKLPIKDSIYSEKGILKSLFGVDARLKFSEY